MSDHRSQRRRLYPDGESSVSEDSGIYDERILILVFRSINWEIRTLCQTASVNRKLRALARRILWRELCVYRAPQMITALTNGAPNGRIGGGWQAMAKLMFFCNGCQSTRHFQVGQPTPGHFVKTSRFSKTSGRSFLVKKCRSDLLYVSDPCEHPTGDDDLGLFRGVFWGFMKSRTRACLIRRRVELEEGGKCPFCGARVWSMTAARLIPKGAARRLGSMESGLEYVVCVNGHLYGACWLVPLSSDEEKDDDKEEDGSEEGYFNGGNEARIGNIPASVNRSLEHQTCFQINSIADSTYSSDNLVHKFCKDRFESVFVKFPLQDAVMKDTVEWTTEPNFNLKEYLQDAYLHPVLRGVELEISKELDEEENNRLVATKRTSRWSSKTVEDQKTVSEMQLV